MYRLRPWGNHAHGLPRTIFLGPPPVYLWARTVLLLEAVGCPPLVNTWPVLLPHGPLGGCDPRQELGRVACHGHVPRGAVGGSVPGRHRMTLKERCPPRGCLLAAVCSGRWGAGTERSQPCGLVLATCPRPGFDEHLGAADVPVACDTPFLDSPGSSPKISFAATANRRSGGSDRRERLFQISPRSNSWSEMQQCV